MRAHPPAAGAVLGVLLPPVQELVPRERLLLLLLWAQGGGAGPAGAATAAGGQPLAEGQHPAVHGGWAVVCLPGIHAGSLQAFLLQRAGTQSRAWHGPGRQALRVPRIVLCAHMQFRVPRIVLCCAHKCNLESHASCRAHTHTPHGTPKCSLERHGFRALGC